MASASQGCVDIIWVTQGLEGKTRQCTSKELSGDGSPKESNNDSSKGSKKSNMSNKACEEIDLKAASEIRLNVSKNVLVNVYGISTTKELWEKLEAMYQVKSISN